jgi:ankyrin repeat protein
MDVVLRLVKEWGYPVQLRTALAKGWTPLHAAAENGDVATIGNLLADCGNPNVADDHKATPLHFASRHSHLDAMAVLLKAGADHDARDADGDPPLEWAAEKGQIESIKFLAKNGANVNAKNESGRTTLQVAAELGQLEIVKFLVMAGADVNAKDDGGRTALSLAVADRHIEVMSFLVSVGSKMSADALYYPVVHGEEDVVRSALKGVSNVNAKLTDALNYDNTLLHEAARNGQLEIVKLLVAAGADLNPLNHSNRTPLFEAIDDDQIAVEDFLITLGGDVKGGERSDRDQLLWHAVGTQGERRTEAIRLLVAAGVDPNPPTHGPAFFTLLSFAIEEGIDAQVVKALVKAGAHINEEVDSITPLLRAVRKDQSATIEVLVEAGAKVEQGGAYAGETPLQLAVAEGHLAATKALLGGIVDAERWKREEDAEDLVSTPPPLSIAAEKGYVEILKVLLEAGANVNRTNPSESKTPLSIALASRNQAVVELLRAHGAK